MLARREYFRAELERKLLQTEEVDGAELAQVLDEFVAKGWLSEERAAEVTVSARKSRYGAGRIVAELERRGAGDEAVQQAADSLRDSELERARAVWRRRFRAPPASLEERARQTRFLAGRGFAADVIARALRTESEMEEK